MSNKAPVMEPFADGLFMVQRSDDGSAMSITFCGDARGRSDHKQTPEQKAAQAAMRKAEAASNVTIVPLLIVLRKLTSRGHLDLELDPKILFCHLERLRFLQRETQALNSHTGAEIDADPLLTFRVRQLLDTVNGFGYALPPQGGKLEIEAIDAIVEFLETEYKENVADARASMREDGTVNYLSLQEVYHIGDTVFGDVGSLGGQRMAYRVNDVHYETQKSLFGLGVKKHFHLALEFIGAVGDDNIVISFEEVVDDWPEMRAMSTLTYTPLSEKGDAASVLEPLKQRGLLACAMARGHHYRRYRAGCFFAHRSKGVLGSSSGPSASVLATSGTIVVDTARGLALGYSQAPGYDAPSLAYQQTAKHSGVVRRANQDGESEERRRERMRAAGLRVVERVPEGLAHICWPALVGFSLNAKSWGHVLVDGLSDVPQGGDAWDALVLPKAKKELLLALAAQKLVANAKSHSVDAVAGKGSGSLFLLHGPPGVGKTLTAEALAAHYGRPLYCLTFGELGSSVTELEARMNEVLQLCSAWRCVCLLDEGDALVERREKGALLLNSLVSVLLKSLDSFEGLLFLTTNRVATFDPAALSRVTLAIRYNQLTHEARQTVWAAVLKRAGCDVTKFSLEILADRPYSGRDINNVVRLALALAEHRDIDLNQSTLDEALAIADDFKAEMEGNADFQ